MEEEKRLTPEEALKLCKEESYGKLKVFLGYAPGVGKTYSMLSEANRRLSRGENVVVGYFESHSREDTIAQLKDLPMVPLKEFNLSSITLKEMDVDKIIELHPDLVLVDELAHTNAKGSKNPKRYMDVLELLEAGINVYTTINLQHLESLNDIIFQITGIKVNETVPDSLINNATVAVIDIPTDALRNRLLRGNIYKKELVERSLKNFFRIGNLSALRELTLRQIADDVCEELEEYMHEHNLLDNWHTVERIMVSISSNPKSKRLIRTGARMAKKYKCEFYAVYVDCTHNLSPKDDKSSNKKYLYENIALAEKFDAQIVSLTGKSVSTELVKFAKEHHITKLIIGHSRRTTFQKLFRGSTINKILENAKDIEIIVMPY